MTTAQIEMPAHYVGQRSCCPSCRRVYDKEYYIKTRARRLEIAAQVRARNPGGAKIAKLKWQNLNKEAHRASRKRTYQRKYLGDINYRLSMIVRGHLRRSIIAAKLGNQRQSVHLPYSVDDLRKRLSVNLKPGMTWDNYGEWHIDHRVPLVRLSKAGKAYMANMLCNLQPLWANENFKKGSR